MWASAQTEGGEAVNMPDSDIRILYEDSEILLVQKPAGMPSQPDPCGQPDLLTVLARRMPVWLVHRLDTPTGGVMVFARTPHAAAALSRTVQDHERFVKEYLCVLPAAPQEPEGVLTDWLYHDSRRNQTYPVAPPREGSTPRKGVREARLAYRTIGIVPDGTALVLARLYTGRTHQIRAQFASRGLPLLGDGKYGSHSKLPNIALWAVRLTVPHPTDGHPVCATCLPTGEPWSRFDLPKGQMQNPKNTPNDSVTEPLI